MVNVAYATCLIFLICFNLEAYEFIHYILNTNQSKPNLPKPNESSKKKVSSNQMDNRSNCLTILPPHFVVDNDVGEGPETILVLLYGI